MKAGCLGAKPKSVLLRLDKKCMQFDREHCYIAVLPAECPVNHDEARSRILVFENGVELGPGSTPHAAIRVAGAGRYSHWRDKLFFSTSDNSSPIQNARDYFVLIPASMFEPESAAAVLGVDVLAIGDLKPMERFAFARALFREIWRDTPLPDHGRQIENDREFKQDFARVSPDADYTFERKYNLAQLFKLVHHVDGDVAECGAYKGGSAFFLARDIVKHQLSKTLFLFDSFEGLSVPAGIDGDYWEAGALTSTIEDIKSTLAPLGPTPFVEIYKGWIPERFAEVADRRFCFVHIDLDLFEPTASSIAFFYQRMAPGGIILLDDYGFETCPGATTAVDQFMAGRSEPIINLASGGALILKRK
jgi:Macrocin-O-methyltransferase (TylF)